MFASWLSELWRQLTGNKKIPDEILCQKLTTRRIQVIGKNGVIELSAGEGGCRIYMNNPDAATKNAFSVFFKANSEINFDFIGPDGSVVAALDVAPDGTVNSRIP